LDQPIPHLAVQCGNKTVHSLSESLANILTGDGSALYIPRFALTHMTESESKSLFETHDTHVKSLRWLLLNPLLSNLDKPRKEYNSNGTVTERTTREWARNIKSSDGTTLAQCDVVNGGSDQLSYLLFHPQHTDAATNALSVYRQLLYPYTQREAKFRESVGPPPFIHMSRSVIANLDFIKNLSTASASPPSDTATNVSDSKDSSSSTASPDSDITESSPTQAVRPPTSAESLQKLYRRRTFNSSAQSEEVSQTSDECDESTSATTATETSKLSEGRMSTSSAKIREIDAVLQRQNKINAKKEAKSSERISSIERQLHRINDLETKLDDAQTDFGCRLNLFETRMVESVTSTMNSNMQQLMGLINQLSSHDKENHSDLLSITEIPAPMDPSTVLRDQLLYTRESSSSSTSNSGSQSSSSNPTFKSSSSSSSAMSVESSARIQSPEHKRLRSGKKPLKTSIRRHLDSAMEAVSNPPVPNLSPPSTAESHDSLDKVMTEVEDILKTDFSSTDHIIDQTETTDPESQYTAGLQSTQDTNTTASPSPGRASDI
jgi:hypothetical protein